KPNSTACTAVSTFTSYPNLARTFTDGTSNTLLVTEKIAGQNPGALWANNDGVADQWSPVFGVTNAACSGNQLYKVSTSQYPQFSPNPPKSRDVALPSTYHEAITVLMGDGAVRNISPSVTQATWFEALTPDSGNTLGSDWPPQ